MSVALIKAVLSLYCIRASAHMICSSGEGAWFVRRAHFRRQFYWKAAGSAPPCHRKPNLCTQHHAADGAMALALTGPVQEAAARMHRGMREPGPASALRRGAGARPGRFRLNRRFGTESSMRGLPHGARIAHAHTQGRVSRPTKSDKSAHNSGVVVIKTRAAINTIVASSATIGAWRSANPHREHVADS